MFCDTRTFQENFFDISFFLYWRYQNEFCYLFSEILEMGSKVIPSLIYGTISTAMTN